MKLAKIDNPTVQNSLIDFASTQFHWAFPGFIWVDAKSIVTPIAGYCTDVSSLGAGIANKYSIQTYPCGNIFYHICEF
jgi:hypothetical protein